jgi:hypothetical protein
MAHFAILGPGNIVQQVLLVSNDIAITEQAGIDFLRKTFNNKNLIAVQTSYNTQSGIHVNGGNPLRANYAGVGFQYDQTNDVFYSQRPIDMYGLPCNSWTISAPKWTWTSPVPMPTPPDGQYCGWNEALKTWVFLGTTKS